VKPETQTDINVKNGVLLERLCVGFIYYIKNIYGLNRLDMDKVGVYEKDQRGISNNLC
jgi:hypothetical protein